MNNKILKLIYACTLAASVMTAGQSLANTKDVAVTQDGQKVLSTYGDCVRTKWDADTDKCHDQAVAHKPQHDHAIMKMKERIVLFDFDKANLKSSETAKLDVLVKALIEHKVKAVKIVGYTDRIGTSQYNQNLSRKRAEAVKHYLKGRVKLDSSLVSLRALGEQDEIESCKGITARLPLIDCLAPNRRVEVEIDYVSHAKK